MTRPRATPGYYQPQSMQLNAINGDISRLPATQRWCLCSSGSATQALPRAFTRLCSRLNFRARLRLAEVAGAVRRLAAGLARERGELRLGSFRGSPEGRLQELRGALREDAPRLLVPPRNGAHRNAHVHGERQVGHPQRPLQRAGAGTVPRRDHFHGALSATLPTQARRARRPQRPAAL
jgi:hypothetical protein